MKLNPFEKYAFPIIGKVTNDEMPSDWDWRYDGFDGVMSEYPDVADFPLIKVLHNDPRIPDFVEEQPSDEELEKVIDGLIEESGLRTLAFYKSPHFLNEPDFTGAWGIFIHTWALRHLANKIRRFHPNPWNKLVTQAFWFLCGHEHYHWYVDAWTIDKEALLDKDLYRDYIHKVYNPNFPYGCFEEALANRNARSAVRLEGILTFMNAFMKRQPGMYAKYDQDKHMLRAHLAGQIIECPDVINSKTLIREDLEPWLATSWAPILNTDNCPIYLIKGNRPLTP